MARLTFKGGVHPYEGKELSEAKPSKDLLPGKVLVFPLSQHIGAPAMPIVKAGDSVSKGQKIAEPREGLSVAIHCSIDGKVEKVSDKEIVVRGK